MAIVGSMNLPIYWSIASPSLWISTRKLPHTSWNSKRCVQIKPVSYNPDRSTKILCDRRCTAKGSLPPVQFRWQNYNMCDTYYSRLFIASSNSVTKQHNPNRIFCFWSLQKDDYVRNLIEQQLQVKAIYSNQKYEVSEKSTFCQYKSIIIFKILKDLKCLSGHEKSQK